MLCHLISKSGAIRANRQVANRWPLIYPDSMVIVPTDSGGKPQPESRA